jgi:butyryl-CoA dehydrogenase
MGVLSTSMAVQVLGGAGYTTDFPVEQYFRESRIHPIHEGTTGIHGLDLLGRKVWLHEGLGWKLLQEEIQQSLNQAKLIEELQSMANSFERHLNSFNHAARELLFKRNQDPEKFLADATLFLEATGIICIGWMWLNQAITSHQAIHRGETEQGFYFGKIEAARYYMEYEIVKILGLIPRFQSSSYPTLVMQSEWF